MSNPNRIHLTEATELTSEERNLLSLSSINEWRTYENGELAAMREANNFSNPHYAEDFNSSVEGLLDSFLEAKGITKDTPNYNEIRQLFYDARIGRGNGDGISENEWGNSPASRGIDANDYKSQSDVFRERIEERLTELSPIEEEGSGSEAEALHSEALIETDARMEALTKKYAEDVAERSKHMIEGAKTRADIDASKEELSDLIGAIATEYMIDIQGQEYTNTKWQDMPVSIQDEIVAAVDAFVVEQTDKVISQMEEVRTASYENSRPVTKKFLDKWAGWGKEDGFITKGKLKKAAVFAVPGAVVGAAAMPLIGAVGAGAGIGAGAFMLARSVGRRLAGTKLDATADSRRIAEEQSADIRSRINDNDDASHHDILEIINERSESYRKRNRNRMIGGTAIALSVGLISGTASDIISNNLDNWSFGKMGELLSKGEKNLGIDTDNNADIDNLPDDGTSTPEIGQWGGDNDYDSDGVINSEDPDKDGDGVPNEEDFKPRDPDVTEKPHDWSEISSSARWVEPGEGWYQTFSELGIPQSHWEEVLKDAGPRLQEQGWSYRMPNGDWGISHPGRLADSSLKIIADAAKRNGYSIAS